MTTELKQVFATPDGKTFNTRAEAQDYLRRPLITAALSKVTDNNSELVTWLIENQDVVEAAFESGTIRRVTKSEKKKLEKALEAIVAADDPKFAFISDNHAAVLETFRWPSVKRMNDEEKIAAAKETLLAETGEGNGELVDWILSSKDAILAAYAAGVEKREVNPKAQEALAAYRAKKKAEKEAAEGGAPAPASAPTPAPATETAEDGKTTEG